MKPTILFDIAALALERSAREYEALPLYRNLIRYRDEGFPIGDFLTALLSNDLSDAVGRADESNIWILPIYVKFLREEMPLAAWGSREKVAEWLHSHRPKREGET